jgi:hypothetical protein
MRRSVPVIAAVLLLAAASAQAITRADLERIIDPAVTLKSLSAVASGSAPLPTGRLALLTGTVSDVSIIDKEKAGFRVRVELITGEWLGLEDVKSYACYVEFSGPEYFAVFPAKPPRAATPGIVTQNTRLVVIGRPVAVVDTPLGAKHVLVEGLFVRATE